MTLEISTVDHRAEAERYLRMADTTRNADGFRGDRDAASLAQATIAQAHATLVLAAALQGKLAVYNANAI